MSETEDKPNTLRVKATPPPPQVRFPPTVEKQISRSSHEAAPVNPLWNFKHSRIYFPWGLLSEPRNQAGQYYSEKKRQKKHSVNIVTLRRPFSERMQDTHLSSIATDSYKPQTSLLFFFGRSALLHRADWHRVWFSHAQFRFQLPDSS